MDFKSMTADDLLAVLPPSEDDHWEFKSAIYLTNQSRGELKKELGKQVSAFANSGGGYLVFGLSDDRQLESCEQAVGRQPMKDFLATMVEQSVEYPIRHFQVHRIPFANEPAMSVFVVAIEDSPAAPHQAKEERIYYYRIDGHSKPAPHFHVELLRNRMTKAVLQVMDIDYVFQGVEHRDTSPRLNIALTVTVENQSLQSATNWGVYIKTCREDYRWKARREQAFVTEGVCIHGECSVLLPSEKTVVTIHLCGEAHSVDFLRLWEEFAVHVRAVSQNHLGEEHYYTGAGFAARRRLEQEIEQSGSRAS